MPTTLAEAIRAAYVDCGLTQLKVVELVTEGIENGALQVDDIPGALDEARKLTQTKLSRWSRGEDEPPKEIIPVIEWACGLGRGAIWARAGYTRPVVSLPELVEMDPRLSAQGRRMVLTLYDAVAEKGPDAADE